MELDLTTIGGVVAVALSLSALVIKKLQVEDDNAKKLIAGGIAGALAGATRLLGLGFADMDWAGLVTAILGSIFATKISYDSVIKPVAKKCCSKKG